jgi:hypothetical protein
MSTILGYSSAESAALLASVIAFTAFFLIGRVVNARQGVAFAFAFTPWLAMIAVVAGIAAFI